MSRGWTAPEPARDAVDAMPGDVLLEFGTPWCGYCQRLKTQLDQYTDLNEDQKAQIGQIAPPEALQGFKGVYLETAKRLKEQQDKQGDQASPEVQQLDC